MFFEAHVGSKSPLKLTPSEQVLSEIYPKLTVRVHGHNSSSDINEQPEGLNETFQGALNRLNHTKEDVQRGNERYDLLIAMENGIVPFHLEGRLHWLDLACVIVESPYGLQGRASSTGIEFDEEFVEEARKRGFVTTTVGSVVAERMGSASNDPQSFLTHHLVSRADMLKQSLRSAIGQLQMKEGFR